MKGGLFFSGVEMSFELVDENYKYVIKKGEKDEVNIEIYGEYGFSTSLKTYLWYFDVDNFDELMHLDKQKVIDIIYRQRSERYFHPMPFDRVRQYVLTLINNTIMAIDEAIESMKNRTSDFPSLIKDIAEIDCIFTEGCEVTLELDDSQWLSSYYSLIGTEEGHMPVPIFLEYVGVGVCDYDDEGDISVTKNLLYFIRGHDKRIPEYERDPGSIGDDVRGAMSQLFQKAVVLYNRLGIEDSEDDEGCDGEEGEEFECPEHTLPDGMGYCRQFDYEPLMKKSEEELMNEIIESLIKIRDKMVTILRGLNS